jgi:hypothetical protein
LLVYLHDLIAPIKDICCYHHLDFLFIDLCVEEIMHQTFRSLIIVFTALAIVACSNDKKNDSVSTFEIEGWVGAQGLNNAQVIANQVAESGQVSVDTNGIYIGLRESTDVSSKFTAVISPGESNLLIARGQIANVDRDNNNLATKRLCQVKAGCIVAGTDYEYAAYYPLTSGFEWRSIIFNASENSRNNVNAITTMADAFAYLYDVKSIDDTNLDSLINEVYTSYDIVLANSQLSVLLGLDDVIGDLPANLPLLDFLTASSISTSNQIRYAALIAGLQQLELEYQANINVLIDTAFMTKVASEFAADEGQIFYHTEAETRELTLVGLYQAAHDNLLAIVPDITNNEIKVLVSQVVAELDSQIKAALAQPVDTKTTAQADDLTKLLTESEISNINLGLEKTKLFVDSLLDLQNTFWEEGYKQELDVYHAMLKTIGDTHKDNLNALVAEFAHIQDYYVTCIIGGSRCDSDFSDLETRKTSYDPVTKILVLDSGALTVSQALADLNVTDTGELSESNAVDILITGTLKKGSLVLKVGPTFTDGDETEINVPSSMRIYYPEEVVEVSPDLIIEGYEIIWGEFQLYDEDAIAEEAETDLSGAFRIFFRGVRDPQVADPDGSELRFNIENWVLSSLITDSVLEGAGDGDTTTLVITAQASNPALFYPSTKFANFEGFFEPNNSHNVDDVEPGLLSYHIGEERVNFESDSIMVETIDFINNLGGDTRYRFFPNMWVEDKRDSNGNGDTEELVVMHLIEECELKKGTQEVVKCGSKSRIFEERDLQETINGLWELGAFQRTQVDGRGSYFIDFPTVTDEMGCLVLDTLLEDSGPLEGTLLEQQVLGLNSVRVLAEISLKNAEQVALPKTLFDMTVVAPTKEKYKVNAALSHNYTATTTDVEEVIIGSGSNTNVVRVSYDTSADFENAGNFSVFQGGVQLTLEDGSQIVENQDITAFFSESFSEDIHYKMIENEKGVAERCVLSVGSNYSKDPAENPLDDQVFYLNYRNVVYGTIRPEGEDGIWVIRYIDGTFTLLGKLR